MSVLIKGLEMPKEGYIDVRIWCNGTASFAIAKNPYFKEVEAVPVPEPHGDLIDRDKLRAKEFIHDGDAYAVVMSSDIRNAPAIIQSSEE